MGQNSGTVSESGISPEYALGDELRGERATMGKTLLDVQRELRIQASYIAAIEDCDVSAFPNPSFISGYVRSYARYLSMPPDAVFRRFCEESGFQGSKTAGSATNRATGRSTRKSGAEALSFQPKYPLSEARGSAFSGVRLSAIGSLGVLIVLVGGLGYGGWMVLENIQRVQFAPVEDLPLAVADVDLMEAPVDAGLEDPQYIKLSQPVAAASLSDLYRQQELEVPILSPRDGPIASIDPDVVRAPTVRPIQDLVRAAMLEQEGSGPEQSVGSLVAASYATGDVPETAPDPVDGTAVSAQVTVIAERAAWIRVYLENGTVIFERILEKGETYTPPEGVGSPLIWAGNSGSVYVRSGDVLRGPLGRGTRAVRDVSLAPAAIAESFEVVREVPEVISQAFPSDLERTGPVVIQ